MNGIRVLFSVVHGLPEARLPRFSNECILDQTSKPNFTKNHVIG